MIITRLAEQAISHPAVTTTVLALQQGKPDENFPGVKTAKALFNGSIAIALVLCGIAVVLGGGAFAIGRAMSHGTAQKIGLGFVLGALIGAAVIGSAAVIVNFGFSGGL